jgi:glycosyltransferase involved in cell wall biosynthesis
MVKLSVLTPVLNSEKTLHDCMKSILNQHADIEHIIIDGKSSDGTLKIISEYDAHVAKIISEPDRGIYDALNKGIAVSTGEVIGILHADDFFASSETLGRISGLFEKTSLDSCYGDLVYVDFHDTSRIIRYWKSDEFKISRFYHGWMPPHPTFFARRSVYEKYGGFNLTLGTAADYELMLRLLLRHQISTVYLPEIITCMRVGGESNASLASRLRANFNDRKAWRINELKPYPWTLAMKPLRKVFQYRIKSGLKL